MSWEGYKLEDSDLDFLLSTNVPQVRDRFQLRELLMRDPDFRSAFVGDEKTFQRVMSDDEAFLKISPRLYFEILLRKTLRELQKASHTLEIAGTQKIPIFDTDEVVELLARQEVLLYLADMLASFVKVQGFTLTYRTPKGFWRKERFSDLDIDSLSRFSETVDESRRLGFFKRIADICLFILGVFPEYVELAYAYPLSGELRPQIAPWARRSLEDYENEGKRYYELAAEHPAARAERLDEVFEVLHEHFYTAKKPLNFLAEHYLHYRRQNLFAMETP